MRAKMRKNPCDNFVTFIQEKRSITNNNDYVKCHKVSKIKDCGTYIQSKIVELDFLNRVLRGFESLRAHH